MLDLTDHIETLEGRLFASIPNYTCLSFYRRIREWEVAGYLELCEDQYRE